MFKKIKLCPDSKNILLFCNFPGFIYTNGNLAARLNGHGPRISGRGVFGGESLNYCCYYFG